MSIGAAGETGRIAGMVLNYMIMITARPAKLAPVRFPPDTKNNDH